MLNAINKRKGRLTSRSDKFTKRAIWMRGCRVRLNKHVLESRHGEFGIAMYLTNVSEDSKKEHVAPFYHFN